MKENKIQILDYFKGLEFKENSHTYYYDSKPIKISVSGLIKHFYKPFDSHKISLRIAERDGVKQSDVLKEWDNEAEKAIKKGNGAHFFGEVYPFNRHLEPSNKYEEAVVKFWNDLPSHIIPVIMELRMFHKKYMFAGTADILLYNTLTDTYIIGDYKTNKDLFKNFKGQKMLGPFSNLYDCPFSKYQLQLSFYQILFEQIGLKVSSRKLIWLLPDGNYSMYNMDDCTDILNQELKNNRI